jgi:CRP-like cAMP-binding protein
LPDEPLAAADGMAICEPITRRFVMFIKQAELFWGLSHKFIKSVMDKGQKETFDTGYLLFSEGDPARRFYTLITGRVKLSVGDENRTVFTVSRAGESFGWSSLVGRDVYSATARCSEPTTVIRIDCEDFWNICTRQPDDGMMFMKRLAALLGHRLVNSYDFAQGGAESREHHAIGSGQVAGMTTEE